MTAALCQALEWDSAFFGRRIARVAVPDLRADTWEAIRTWCEAHDIDCLYFLAAPDDVETCALASAHGFRLVDVRLDFERVIAADDPRGRYANVRAATDRDIPDLRAIAGEAHRVTRFYADGRFPIDRCDELYRTWIARSVEGFADGVLVASRAGRAVGYLTMHLEAGTHGRIGLVGVAADRRGEGVGGQLVSAAFDWFRCRQRTHVTVATQARNLAAARVYERAGFTLRQVGLWYHRWFDRAAGHA